MRPHRLRVQAFGAFAGAETVAFDDLEGLFLLHGETGAGKTTLLDAIAFALYGRVPGERASVKRLRSDHAAPGITTEVELEATIGGRRLRITRKPEQERVKRRGAGTTREQTSVRLEELGPDGAWENKSTRVAEADAEILELMGMSADQFFQVVLLPQGQFAQFLQAKAQEKELLLQKLFGTDRYRRVEDWLADRRRATEREVVAAAGVVNRLVAQLAQAAGAEIPASAAAAGLQIPQASPVPAAWPLAWAAVLTARAAADRDAAAVRMTACRQELDQALAAREAARRLADRQRRRRDALRRQAELEAAGPRIALLSAAADAALRAAEVAPVIAEADRAAAAAEAASAEETVARAAVGALPVARAAVGALPDRAGQPSGGGPALADAAPELLRAAARQQREQLGLLDALRAVAGQAADEDKNGAAARDRAALIDADLGEVRAGAARRLQARPQAAEARDAAARAAAELPAAQLAADRARRDAADATALVSDRAQRDLRRQGHLDAREGALRLQAAALRVREARIDGMRAELAAAMTDGTPCPVCGSLEHPDPVEPTFARVSRDQEEAANAAAEQAAAAADLAGQEVAAVEARIGELASRLDAAGFAGVLSGTAAGTPAPPAVAPAPAFSAVPPFSAVPAFSAALALGVDPASLAAAARQLDASAKALEGAAGRLKSQAATFTVLQRALDDLDEAIARDTARLVELTGQRTAALAEAGAAAERAAARRAELTAGLGGAQDLDAALAATRLAAETFSAAADAADAAARAGQEARAARQRAAESAIAAGFEPQAAANTNAAAASASAASAAAAAAAAAGPADAVAAARAATRDAGWRKEAAADIKRHDAETEAVASLLADPDLATVELDPPAPVAETTEMAARAQQAHDAAAGAHGTASHTADQLAGLQPRLADALAVLAPLQEQAEQVRQLADLAAGLGANQYKMTLSSFVLAARLEEVAQAASQRLLAMSSGRYSLAHSDARRGNARAGLSLLVADAWTGQDRETATLSGGETFQASLALALGLADVVTAESAGTPMEALFVDEGFGTLDEDALDEVMNVLDGLRAGGRVVGIVSHVTELRQRIPAQVHVRKSRTGSRVEVTAG